MNIKINDEQGTELLYYIFERELKPPFTSVKITETGYHCYNSNNEIIGRYSLGKKKSFRIPSRNHLVDIRLKVIEAFDYSKYNYDWIIAVKPYLRSWLSDKLNAKFDYLYIDTI